MLHQIVISTLSWVRLGQAMRNSWPHGLGNRPPGLGNGPLGFGSWPHGLGNGPHGLGNGPHGLELKYSINATKHQCSTKKVISTLSRVRLG